MKIYILLSPKWIQIFKRRLSSTLCFHLLRRFMEQLIFFSTGLRTCPRHQNYYQILYWWCYCCAWLAKLWFIAKKIIKKYPTQQSTDKLNVAIKATWASVTPEQRHNLITSMPHQSIILNLPIGPSIHPISCTYPIQGHRGNGTQLP